MTEALFLETARYEEQLLEEGKRRPNVSGVLRILGVSRNGYLTWKKRLPSNREKRKEQIKERIIEIYQESHHVGRQIDGNANSELFFRHLSY